MQAHLLSPWEIVLPQEITVCTGDVTIDDTLVALLLLMWMIRAR